MQAAIELQRVGGLQPSFGYEVGVVHDDVRVRDPVFVVVVKDDRHLEVGEVPLRPRLRELGNLFCRESVLGVGG